MDMAEVVNEPFCIIAGNCSGNINEQAPNNMENIMTNHGIHFLDVMYSLNFGRHITAKKNPPKSPAMLCKKTNTFPGVATAWKQSMIPMLKKPKAIMQYFPPSASCFFCNKIIAIIIAINPPVASIKEWNGSLAQRKRSNSSFWSINVIKGIPKMNINKIIEYLFFIVFI